LQERLVMGSALAGEGRRMRDFQTAQLGGKDRGWTTRGRIEERAGGADTYKSPHIRYRDMDADARVLVALRFDPADEEPVLDMVAQALDRPERPLFIGRKPFLPSRPLLLGVADAETVRDALAAGLALLPDPPGGGEPQVRAQWPLAEGLDGNAREEELTDERHWPAGVHAGLRRVAEGSIPRPVPLPADAEAIA
jgi:CRISPR system Cascade subunit CasD